MKNVHLDHPAPLRVGIDFDGVMYDYVQSIREDARRLLMIPREVIAISAARQDKDVVSLLDHLDPEPAATHWNFFEDWGLTGKEFAALNRWGIQFGSLFLGQPISEEFGQALVDLKAAGHTLHGLTHRSLPGAIARTDQWLRENKIDDLFDSMTFVRNTSDKSQVDLDVLIDDKNENVIDWQATGKPAIVYDRPWNKTLNTGATRVFNPGHLVAAIGALSKFKAAEINAATAEPETILQEAQRLVHGDRGEDYGHPIEDFSRTGRIWGAILGTDPIPPQDVAMCMIGVKMSREVNRPKRDNRADMAGYAETLDMVVDYQETHATVPA